MLHRERGIWAERNISGRRGISIVGRAWKQWYSGRCPWRIHERRKLAVGHAHTSSHRTTSIRSTVDSLTCAGPDNKRIVHWEVIEMT